jgi:hypothetical protein
MKTLLCFLALAAPLAAQSDFLTTGEVERIREAQEPNARLEIYAGFAKERVDLVKSLIAKDKPGRSILIHDTLDAYSKILDAMDDVTDDALERRIDVNKGVAAMERVEMAALAELKRVQDGQPKDLDRYAFVLTQAIDTTSDSLDAAREDLGSRMNKILAHQEEQDQERKAAMAPANGAAKPSDENKAASPQSTEKKAPTLMRPGEQKPNQ